MLPLNGRVAVVDDKYSDVKCLLSDLSKHQVPFRFYHFEGDPDILPIGTDSANDFRILIMDLNLINDGALDSKTLISSLTPVLDRLIPSTNYPYVFAYWSKHEDEYKDDVENTLFQTDELKDKQPIAYVSLEKSKYIALTGEPTTAPIEIFEEISNKLSNLEAYKALLRWENIVHSSADNTIQEVFSFDEDIQKWSDTALDLLSRFSKASLGNKKFKDSDNEMRIKSSIAVLEPLFIDSLETSIYQESFGTCGLDTVNRSSSINIANVNKKLLLDLNTSNPSKPGMLSLFTNAYLKDFLVEQFDEKKFSHCLKADLEKIKTKAEKSEFKREQIERALTNTESSALQVQLCVDAICDFTNKKVRYSKFIEGVLVSNESRDYFYDNEAIFVSPVFIHNEKEYCLLLNFQYLSTQQKESITPIFRVREEMLSEIQSKLARHINRQGILNL
jgi:hypothetical protein